MKSRTAATAARTPRPAPHTACLPQTPAAVLVGQDLGTAARLPLHLLRGRMLLRRIYPRFRYHGVRKQTRGKQRRMRLLDGDSGIRALTAASARANGTAMATAISVWGSGVEFREAGIRVVGTVRMFDRGFSRTPRRSCREVDRASERAGESLRGLPRMPRYCRGSPSRQVGARRVVAAQAGMPRSQSTVAWGCPPAQCTRHHAARRTVAVRMVASRKSRTWAQVADHTAVSKEPCNWPQAAPPKLKTEAWAPRR